jgi:serine protease Do
MIMEFQNGESNYVVEKKKSKARPYIAAILISAVVSSTATGGVLSYMFNNKINTQLGLIQKSSSVLENLNSSPSSSTGLTKTSIAGSNISTVTGIAKKVGPSVVGIRVSVGSPRSSYWGSMQNQSAEGSGVVISKDGYIMTNYHVVEYADPKSSAANNTTLEVFLPDQRQAKAKFIGGDSRTDLAVIKIDLNNLTVAELGDSSKLEVGELAVAIGNPLGMEFAGSVTTGVISALNRQVQTDDKTLNLIQTDAAINPGNSGGALVNSQGQVIGINTIKISVTGVEGLGFAIPINDAKPIINQLIMFGYVKGRPLIGISGQEVTSVIAAQYDIPQGIYVGSVSSGSGAANAGIQKGDIITSMAGKDVKTMADLDSIKKNYKPGDTVKVVIVRNNSKMTLNLTFSEEK